MRHLAATLAVAAAAGFAVHSCSVDASVSTDRSGRIVSVDAVRLASSWVRVTVSVVVDAGGPLIEFFWSHGSRARAL